MTGNQETQLIVSKVELILRGMISNHSKWELAQDRGLSLCRSIEAKKSKCLQNNEDLYPNDIGYYSSRLKKIIEIFKNILLDTEEFHKNLKALENLSKNSNSLLFEFSKLENIVTYCRNITEKYSSEVKLKQKIVDILFRKYFAWD
ncbi:CINP family protein [Megaselia abdita]